MSHAGFMDSTMLPSAVKDGDLSPEIDEGVAHGKVGKIMSEFIRSIESSSEGSGVNVYDPDTEKFFAPFLEGLELEGSYALKEPCYDSKLVNPDSPKCMRGSPWSE